MKRWNESRSVTWNAAASSEREYRAGTTGFFNISAGPGRGRPPLPRMLRREAATNWPPSSSDNRRQSLERITCRAQRLVSAPKDQTRLPRQQRLRSSRKPLKSDGSAGPTGQIVELQSISAAVWPADRRSPKKRPRLRAANVLRRTTPVLLYATYWNNVRSRLRNDRSRGARMYSARRATNSSGASASALGIAVSLSAISSHPRSCASSAAG